MDYNNYTLEELLKNCDNIEKARYIAKKIIYLSDETLTNLSNILHYDHHNQNHHN